MTEERKVRRPFGERMLPNQDVNNKHLKEHRMRGIVAQDDTKDYVKSLEKHLFEAKHQLERAKGKIERRDKTIKELSRTQLPSTDSKVSVLERKLEDLTNKYSASKAKYQDQLGDLELQNMKLQEKLDILQLSHLSQNELDLPRKRHTQTLVDFDALRMMLSGEKSKEVVQKDEDRALERELIKWEGERSRMERRIEELKESKERSEKKREMLKLEVGELKNHAKLSLKQIKALKEEVKQVKAANDGLEEIIEACTVAYCALHRDTVHAEEYRALEQSYLEMKSELWRWKLKNETDALDFERKRAETRELQERLKAAEDERRVLKEIVNEIKGDRQALRDEITKFALSIGNRNLLDFVPDPFEVTQTSQDVLNATLNHINLSSSYYIQHIETLNSVNDSLTSKLSSTISDLYTCQSTLANLRREHSDLETQHAALDKAHEHCDGVREELLATEKECMFREQKIEGLEEELQRMKIKSRDDAEKVKIANELVARAKSAEQALDEEIRHLREAYIEAAQYQELYNDLQEQHGMVLAREAAATEEAERLAAHNAELAGHSNEVQKISYVEGVRREMTLVKQELATTRHLLNNANDKIQTLENEIAAYKSVDAGLDGLGLGISTRTRVVRRQPEGGRLTASKAGRGISDLDGRHWIS
ncbi:hypothetical protein AYX15_04596 [Cryptococcus neoformans]|nr:hypothetical protein AYX15_04596 [Cryptococcus neoformans var. grubii]